MSDKEYRKMRKQLRKIREEKAKKILGYNTKALCAIQPLRKKSWLEVLMEL